MAFADRNRLRPAASLLGALADNWWSIFLRGVLALMFGVVTLVWPGLTLVALVYLFSAFVFVDGAFALFAAVRGGTMMPRWWLAIIGLAGIVAGPLTLFWPEITALLLITFIGAWSIVRGLFEIIGAISLRREIDNEWMLILAGALSVLFGLVVLVAPGAGALALLWLIGTYAVVSGLMLVGLSLRLRGHRAPA